MLFNVPQSNFLLYAVDNTEGRTIRIEPYKEIKGLRNDKGQFKHTNRNIVPFYYAEDALKINPIIDEWRENTKDFFLTPFRGMTKLGVYRKRISFTQLKLLAAKVKLSDR